MSIEAYLTIDDSPSKFTQEKVDFLYKNKIPTIFYCRGEFMKENMDPVIYAIKKGFLIGNHSYTHPLFSEITLDECFTEIIKTEELIAKCYKEANIARPSKVIRLPFADRGAGKHAKQPVTKIENNKVIEVQKFLSEYGFQPVIFGQKRDDFIDSFWDIDTKDYKQSFINNPNEYIQNLESSFLKPTNKAPIILLHDFNHNHHLFEITMKFLIEKNVRFLKYQTP